MEVNEDSCEQKRTAKVDQVQTPLSHRKNENLKRIRDVDIMDMDMISGMSMATTATETAMSMASSATAAAAAASSSMAMDMEMEMPGDSCKISVNTFSSASRVAC